MDASDWILRLLGRRGLARWTRASRLGGFLWGDLLGSFSGLELCSLSNARQVEEQRRHCGGEQWKSCRGSLVVKD